MPRHKGSKNVPPNYALFPDLERSLRLMTIAKRVSRIISPLSPADVDLLLPLLRKTSPEPEANPEKH